MFKMVLFAIMFPVFVQHRYTVADILKIPHTDPNLDLIISELNCDEDWDETKALQKGYKKAGLKRYNLDEVKNMFQKKTRSEGYSEAFSTSKDGKLKTDVVALALTGISSSSGSNDNMKEESAGWSKFQQKLTVVKSAKGVFIKT